MRLTLSWWSFNDRPRCSIGSKSSHLIFVWERIKCWRRFQMFENIDWQLKHLHELTLEWTEIRCWRRNSFDSNIAEQMKHRGKTLVFSRMDDGFVFELTRISWSEQESSCEKCSLTCDRMFRRLPHWYLHKRHVNNDDSVVKNGFEFLLDIDDEVWLLKEVNNKKHVLSISLSHSAVSQIIIWMKTCQYVRLLVEVIQ